MTYLLADKDYDAHVWRKALRQAGPGPVLSSRYNRKCAIRYDNPDTQTATALRMYGDKIKDAGHLAACHDQRAWTFLSADALASPSPPPSSHVLRACWLWVGWALRFRPCRIQIGEQIACAARHITRCPAGNNGSKKRMRKRSEPKSDRPGIRQCRECLYSIACVLRASCGLEGPWRPITTSAQISAQTEQTNRQ